MNYPKRNNGNIKNSSILAETLITIRNYDESR